MTNAVRMLCVAVAVGAVVVVAWWQQPAHAQGPTGMSFCTVLQLGIAESPERVESRAVLVPQGWGVVGPHPSGVVICK